MLLAGPISHTGIQYMDFIKIINISLELSIYFIFLILVDVELPLCIVVIVVTLSYNAIICFLRQVEYKCSVLFLDLRSIQGVFQKILIFKVFKCS